MEATKWRKPMYAVAAALALLASSQGAQAALTKPYPADDTFLGRQWYLEAIHAPEAWNVTTGTPDVVVAVIDSGIDINHPDLKDNIWTNPFDKADGKDEDEDGYVDDVHGWNFVTGSGDVQPLAGSRRDAWMHGTAVASLIAAKGDNGIGMAGVAWNAKIMPLVAIGKDGLGKDENIVAAIRFAVGHGADIINLSIAGLDYDENLDQAIDEATAQGVLVVIAAGNGEEISGVNLDKSPGFPACDRGVGRQSTLTVTGLLKQGTRADYANFGTCVDVSAPGNRIFAAQPMIDYRTGLPGAGYYNDLSGTSLSAPLVSGVAALLKSKHPDWKGEQLAARILQTTDPISNSLEVEKGKLGSGVVNAWKALQDDAAAQSLGPISLQGAAPGQAPEVRILDSQGKVLERFMAGDPGDRRGIRAAFVDWTGQGRPEVAVSGVGDPTGAWRVYTQNGLLIAAGKFGNNIRGGVLLAAQDIDGLGRETLALAEADGNRIWLVSQDEKVPFHLEPFKTTSTRGLIPLGLGGQAPGFLISARDGQVLVVGKGGKITANARIKPQNGKQVWFDRRVSTATRQTAFQAQGKARFALLPTGRGLKAWDKDLGPTKVMEQPGGRATGDPAWRSFDVWPH